MYMYNMYAYNNYTYNEFRNEGEITVHAFSKTDSLYHIYM